MPRSLRLYRSDAISVQNRIGHARSLLTLVVSAVTRRASLPLRTSSRREVQGPHRRLQRLPNGSDSIRGMGLPEGVQCIPGLSQKIVSSYFKHLLCSSHFVVCSMHAAHLSACCSLVRHSLSLTSRCSGAAFSHNVQEAAAAVALVQQTQWLSAITATSTSSNVTGTPSAVATTASIAVAVALTAPEQLQQQTELEWLPNLRPPCKAVACTTCPSLCIISLCIDNADS